jgi:hypothetical protein
MVAMQRSARCDRQHDGRYIGSDKIRLTILLATITIAAALATPAYAAVVCHDLRERSATRHRE